MRIAILTSSRADYGIYLPLLRELQKSVDIEFGLVVFGTHLSKQHGYTIEAIRNDGFPIFKEIDSLLPGDSSFSISSSYALTANKFAEYWEDSNRQLDLIIALGDRFEMAAAVAASIPFGIKIAHLHGGETTLGAIDNIYRHSITLASTLHFVSAEPFVERVKQLHQGESIEVYNVGSLSLENLQSLPLLTREEFFDKWNIDLNLDTILVTVHPETIGFKQNEIFVLEITKAIEVLSNQYQVIITMPNADTSGLLYRNSFDELGKSIENVKIIENFGSQSYFSAMQHVNLLLGNTSSGLIEAASFGKYVLNVGDRQKGRLCGENVIHVPFNAEIIIEKTNELIHTNWTGSNLYVKPNTSKEIIKRIKQHFG